MRPLPQRKPTPYFNRRDQLRMLMLCTLLLLVLLAIDAARQPANWNWFFALGGPQPPELRQLDFRAIDRPEPLIGPDEFLAMAHSETGEDSTSPDAEAKTAAASKLSQFEHPLLDQVEDQRVGFLRAEQPLLQALFDHLQQTDPAALAAAADPTVGYRVLSAEPEQYRGRLLQLEGILRRYESLAPGDDGERSVMQGWLFTADGGNNPWCVLCTETTPELSAGDQLELPVRVSGYFVKRLGYPTATSLHVAPLLVARRFERLPVEQIPLAPRGEGLQYLAGLVLLITLSIAGIVWRFAVSDRRFARSRLAQIARERQSIQPGDLAILAAADGEGPGAATFPTLSSGVDDHPASPDQTPPPV